MESVQRVADASKKVAATPPTSALPASPSGDSLPYQQSAVAVPVSTPPAGTAAPSEWMAHVCLGSDFFGWLRMLHQGRYRVEPKDWYVAALTTFISFGHTMLRYVQNGMYGERIRNTPIDPPPIFILGHWRTGTTLLHELLIQDPRHTFPNTSQCLDPNHNLLTDSLNRRFFNWLLPKHRPMDRMQFGWERPQECEFGLWLLGAASTYATMAFPGPREIDTAALEIDALPLWRQRHWRKSFRYFLQTILAYDPRRLVLKSPTHTYRIPTLVEMFPGARFVYLIRNPYVVFPSTVNLWKKLHLTQGLHPPDNRNIEETVFRNFARMHDRVLETKHLVPQGYWHELKYEDLTSDPEHSLKTLYANLDLGDFDQLRPGLKQYLASTANYEKNKWELPAETRQRIAERWQRAIAYGGY